MSLPILSSIHVHDDGAHDVVSFWNRGAFAGEIRVQRGDGAKIKALVEVAKAFATTQHYVGCRNEQDINLEAAANRMVPR